MVEDSAIMLKKLHLDGNVLPNSTYEAKNIVCPLGMEVMRIQTFLNDYVLHHV